MVRKTSGGVAICQSKPQSLDEPSLRRLGERGPQILTPTGWRKVPFGEFIVVHHGFPFAGTLFNTNGEGLPVFTPANFYEDGGYRSIGTDQKYSTENCPKEYILSDRELLVVMTEQAPGLLGSPARVPDGQRFLHNQRLGRIEIVDDSFANIDFVFHLLNDYEIRKEISASAAGTKVRHTSPGRIQNVIVNLPTLPEQKAIAAVLSAWDRAIGQTTALTAAKQRLKRAFSNLLLKGTPRFNRTGSGDSLTVNTSDWGHARLGEIFDRTSIRGHESEPVLSVTQDQGIVRRDALDRKISGDADNHGNYKLIEPGDFVISLRSFQGGLEYSAIRGIVSPAYHVIREKRPINHRFFKHYFKSHEFIGRLATSVIGIRDGKQVNFDDFAFVSVPFPPIEEQEKIGLALDAMADELTLLHQSLCSLRKQKRGLMQRLLTGKVRVSESLLRKGAAT